MDSAGVSRGVNSLLDQSRETWHLDYRSASVVRQTKELTAP
jgi:hypothetical protein